jgi:hypothetical protein
MAQVFPPATFECQLRDTLSTVLTTKKSEKQFYTDAFQCIYAKDICKQMASCRRGSFQWTSDIISHFQMLQNMYKSEHHKTNYY